ncbi:unnamed protein product [Caenorhabditis bovis]|uniref:Uncharacterized protein n=1 Tax=Caenorhabditis bovis TaxID=2654633 RepID=A0A8S1F4C8_9PELO|nr:unnamed protein product [Caenorhabditis bovis]
MKGFVAIFVIWLATLADADELLATRCQAHCLHLMETRLQEVAEHRKNLKHHIIQMCKDDTTCSACSAPCREQFDNLQICKKSCVSSDDSAACEASCEYRETIYGEKPGSCPIPMNTSTYECSALCHLDGDCPETQKCCSHGCSRQCMKANAKGARLLPIPRNITIQERKRKRSIIIRWATGKWSKSQLNANANLFLVQWRWGLHTDETAMTEWQTVTVRNKPYAILKHLLSPGRYYQFRIASVSDAGSLGFSGPSEPFKISKEAKAPSAPRDLALGNAKLTPIGLWNQMVMWHPPASDLPIKNYQISWAASTAAEANAFEEMMRKKVTMEFGQHEKRSLEDDEEWGISDQRDRHSVIVPSHSSHTEISGLFPNSVYIVEIHATVDSSDGELHGEKGIIFIRTADANVTLIPTDPPARISDESEELKMEPENELPKLHYHTESVPTLQVQTPFFAGGELQTNLNWLNYAECDSSSGKAINYIVRVRKTLCREYQPNHHSDTRWHDLRVVECSAVLKGLSFDCDYKVEISDGATDTRIVDGVFSTDTCEQTPALSPVSCATLTNPIKCQVNSMHSAHCHWSRHHDSLQTVIGYRIILSSPMGPDTNITINQPQLREVRYEELKPGMVYNVEVQGITNKGLGRTVSTQFITHSEVDHNQIERFPGGEIIELPLESHSSYIVPSFLLFISFIFVLLRF